MTRSLRSSRPLAPAGVSTRRVEELEREDLITFVNAAMACTGQAEFYGDGHGQTVSIGFLHEYVLVNYRSLYARSLAAGINDFNAGLVITNLLRRPAAGADPAERRAEGALIAAALDAMPPQRAYRVLAGLRRLGVCNRRAKAIAAGFLASRKDPAFHAVKYRRQIKDIVRHLHLRTPGETGTFLFHGHRSKRYETPLFDTFRRAHYGKSALYELPFTIAEGLAGRAGIDRATFLAGIAPRMTQLERARLQNRGEGIEGVELQDLGQMPLTRLAVYVLSLPMAARRARADELRSALQGAARRAARRANLRLGHVSVVLDNSYSTTGSRAKHNRPLALALAALFLLRECAEHLVARWVTPVDDPLFVRPRGHTDLATPLLAALADAPDVALVLSDGHDNDPPGGAAQVAHAFRRCVDPDHRVAMVHLNPTFDASSYGAKGIHPDIPMLGIRDAEDIPTMLAFARFVDGSADLRELEEFLQARAVAFAGEEHLS